MFDAEPALAITPFASLWASRNWKDVDGFGAGEADIWKQEHATDGAGA